MGYTKDILFVSFGVLWDGKNWVEYFVMILQARKGPCFLYLVFTHFTHMVTAWNGR